jgi:uncharacterized protein (DUF1330 family)
MPEPESTQPPEQEPRGYFLAYRTVTDPARYAQLRPQITKLCEIYAGCELVSAQRPISVSGRSLDAAITVIEHATVSDLRRCVQSPECAALHESMKTAVHGPVWSGPGLWPPRERGTAGAERPAYCLAAFDIADEAKINRYRDLVGRLVAAHAGRFLMRQQPVTPHPDMPNLRYVTLIEYPSLKRLTDAIKSPDYWDIADMGAGYGEFKLWMVEGV